MGVVAVLVPPHRVEMAKRAYADLLQQRAEAAQLPYPSKIAGVDWDSWLNSWDTAVDALPITADSVAADLAQLRELCLTLGGLHMQHLEQAASGPGWRDRDGDLATLVDQVTRKLRGPSGGTPPIQHEVGYDPMRYVPAGYRIEGSSCSVGLASRFADEGGSPLWLRYHRATPHFSAINDLVLASEYRGAARTDDGHLWLPLTIQPDLAGEVLVDHLTSQVRVVQALLRTP